jgi:hypothetical protein
VRADEKIDPELEQVAEQEIVEDLEEKEAPEAEQAEEIDTSALRFHLLASYIEALIEGNREPETDFGWLNEVEQRGLELLAAAIGGHAHGSARQIYAEDRMVMLEQALAALQPALAAGFESADVDLHVYDTLVADLTELRSELASLADAQEEMRAHDTQQLLGRDDGGKPSIKPPAKPVDAGEVGDDRPSTLAAGGPAAPDKAVVPSTLAAGGPAAPDKPAVPSTLAAGGPVAPEKPVVPSTLAAGGPVAPDKKPQPSTAWDGDDRAGR